MKKTHNGNGDGEWKRLLRRLAEVCAEDRVRWRKSDERHAAHDRRFEELLGEVRQQGGRIDAMQKTLYRLLEGRSS